MATGRRETRWGSVTARLLPALVGLLPVAPVAAFEDQPITAILGAFEAEVAALREEVADPEAHEALGLSFLVGEIAGRRVVVAETGVGKVNAAMTTTLLLDHFRPDCVLFTGIAGSLNDSLLPGDIVIGERTAQHDLAVIQDGGRERFGVRNPLNGDRNPVFLPADDRMLSMATEAAADLRLAEVLTSVGRRIPRVARGTIATGDAFVASAEKKAEIAAALGADAVEMEGAAVAQVCHQHGIPCLVIRSISDHADADADEHLERFYAIAARNSAMLVLRILERLEDGPDP